MPKGTRNSFKHAVSRGKPRKTLVTLTFRVNVTRVVTAVSDCGTSVASCNAATDYSEFRVAGVAADAEAEAGEVVAEYQCNIALGLVGHRPLVDTTPRAAIVAARMEA